MIQILKATDKTPLQHIGENAGICWHAPIDDKDKNIKRALGCIRSGHGRVLEYPTIEFAVSGYSARAIRELYTHIGGLPTRLQESTRYVDCSNFPYYTPNEHEKQIYERAMRNAANSYDELIQVGWTREDAANVLPLGMDTAVVVKMNLRMAVNFFGQRLCSRAYKEMRQLANELRKELVAYSEEWQIVADLLFKPKCEQIGYCTEDKCCGRMPKMTVEEVTKVIKEYAAKRQHQSVLKD